MWTGRVEGKAVAAAMSYRTDSAVGVFGVTTFGIFLTPVFFYVIEGFVERPLFSAGRWGRVSAAALAPLRYARRLQADRTLFYALYNWQVFVKTPSGDRRVTGPGLP